jgi:competence protein ComEC
MIRWTPYIFIRLVFWLILGISVQIAWNLYNPLYLYALLLLSLGYVLIWAFLPKYYRLNFQPINGIFTSAILFIFGLVYTHFCTEAHHPNHIIQHHEPIEGYVAKVVSEVLPRAKSYKATVEISQIKSEGKWTQARGKVMVYFRRDSTLKAFDLQYGDKILLSGTPQLVTPPRNPLEFDYRAYLGYQNINHQHFTAGKSYQFLTHAPDNYLMKWSIQVRQGCDAILKRLIPSEREYALAVALVLGVKDHVDDEVLSAYTATGLMHILAVSGMHVGLIVYALAAIAFQIQVIRIGKRKYRIVKTESLGFTLFLILFLWAYGFITGLSASVLRAVVMFTLVLIGQKLGKRRSVYNTFAFSAFALLLYDPFLLLSVGFQLSYLAVLGIFYIQPKVYQCLTISNWWLDQGWQICSVTIAAQLATFPLGIYYFHQFPNYFLLSNLIILPVSTIVLYIVLATLLLFFIPFVNVGLGWLSMWAIWAMNFLIFQLESMPFQLTSGLYINAWEAGLIYLIIGWVLALLALRKFRYWQYAGIGVLIFTTSCTYRLAQNNFKNEIIIYHLSRQNNLAILHGNKAYIFANQALAEDTKTLNFSVNNYLYQRGVQQPTFLEWQDTVASSKLPFRYQTVGKYALLQYQGKLFLIIRQDLTYQEIQNLPQLQVDYLIIQNNAVKNAETFLDALQCSKVILTATNSPKRIAMWQSETKERKISLYAVSERGAWIERF